MNFKLALIAAAALAACGCMASTSGDVQVEKASAQAMLAERDLVPFAELRLTWTNYPYRSPSDSIGGETTVDDKGNFRSQEVKPVAIAPEEAAKLLRQAKKIFAEAGLYDRQKGRGTLDLKLVTQNRWTYGDLFSTFLVETSFIYIIPASLRVQYLLAADFDTAAGRARTETMGMTKTTFHLLLAPLYPFFPHASKEKSLLRQMLWRTATDTYTQLKRAGAAPAAGATSPAQPAAQTAAAATALPPAAALSTEVAQPEAAAAPAVTPAATYSTEADEPADD